MGQCEGAQRQTDGRSVRGFTREEAVASRMVLTSVWSGCAAMGSHKTRTTIVGVSVGNPGATTNWPQPFHPPRPTQSPTRRPRRTASRAISSESPDARSTLHPGGT